MMNQTGSTNTGQSLSYSWYIVVLCMVAYVFSFIDRQVIALLGPAHPRRLADK